jgi:tetratricopeptide (TPR) repeat protein
MNKRTSIKVAGILFISAILGTTVNAQERNDVIKAYNEGAKAIQTDLPAAIKAFENAITLADQVGETAQDLKDKAIKVLPGLYFKIAYNDLNEKKPAQEIIEAAKKAAEVADKYNSATNKDNAEKVLVQGYNILGSDYFTQNEYDKAVMAFDSLLAINPDYLTAVYNKALVYLKQQNSEAFETTIDLFLEKLKSGDNAERAQQASKMALEYFRAAGSQALQANNLDEALAMLNTATKYGEDKDLYYFLSDVYNKKKDFDKGQEYAQKGLDLETGDAEAKAKFYYQIATAQVGKGETSEACGSFKNAMYGAFAEASKAQRTNLKCKDGL